MDLFKNNLVAGVGLALGAAVLAPILIPTMGRVGRPFAKSLVRGGMMMYEKGREVIAVAGESMEDLMAEIRAEHAVAGAGTAAAAPGESPAAPAAAPGTERRRGGNGAQPVTPGADGAAAGEEAAAT